MIGCSGEPLVSVEHVSKKFCHSLRRSLRYGLEDLGRELLGRSGSSRLSLRRDEFMAVNDVSFEIRRGECLGLIGHNGAGKSTLLKMLSGLIRPDAGRIAMRGRVGALIELGAGFNPVLTGRENIYVNAAVLGMRRSEIESKFDRIVEFAELEKFIDSPVQSYSTGMRVRLGFAVAAHVEPDVLLIDEVLAVGDMAFVLKCFNLLDERQSRTAMVFVSHQMPQVARTCTRVITLDHGRVVADGTPSAAIDAYLSRSAFPSGPVFLSGAARVQGVELLGNGATGAAGEPFRIGHLDDLVLSVRLSIAAEHPSLLLYLAINDRELRTVGETWQSNADALQNHGAPIEVRVTLPRLNLAKGVYSIDLTIKNADAGIVLGRWRSIAVFQVIADHVAWVPVHFESRFEQIQ